MKHALVDHDIAGAEELLHTGDCPDDEDNNELWTEYEEARSLRDEILLPSWRGAADSLHAAYEVIRQHPWLKEWHAAGTPPPR